MLADLVLAGEHRRPAAGRATLMPVPDLAFAAREYLARHGITAQQVTDHMDRPIDYVLDQLTGEIPLGVDLVLSLAALTADTPEQVSAELASIAATLVDPPRFDSQTMARALAQEISDQRKARNMTQQQLANLVGESPDTIAMYESGGLGIPLDALRRIAAALDTYATHVMIAAERKVQGDADG